MCIKHLAIRGLSNSTDRIKSSCNLINFRFEMPNVSYTRPMAVTDDGFIIRKYSQANKNVSVSMTENYKILRQKLIETNILIDMGDFYEFSEDAVFSSPSAASNIILGRQSAGPMEWINSDGKPFKEIVENIP